MLALDRNELISRTSSDENMTGSEADLSDEESCGVIDQILDSLDQELSFDFGCFLDLLLVLDPLFLGIVDLDLVLADHGPDLDLFHILGPLVWGSGVLP